MHQTLSKTLLSLLITFISVSLYAQTNSGIGTDDPAGAELKNDTLFTNSGLEIYAGQKLYIGNPAGQNGYFRAVIPYKAALVPEIWGRDTRYESQIENYVDSRKNKEKAKKTLIPGDSLIVQKVKLMGKKNKYHFYLVELISAAGKFKCDMMLALKLEELTLQP